MVLYIWLSSSFDCFHLCWYVLQNGQPHIVCIFYSYLVHVLDAQHLYLGVGHPYLGFWLGMAVYQLLILLLNMFWCSCICSCYPCISRHTAAQKGQRYTNCSFFIACLHVHAMLHVHYFLLDSHTLPVDQLKCSYWILLPSNFACISLHVYSVLHVHLYFCTCMQFPNFKKCFCTVLPYALIFQLFMFILYICIICVLLHYRGCHSWFRFCGTLKCMLPEIFFSIVISEYLCIQLKPMVQCHLHLQPRAVAQVVSCFKDPPSIPSSQSFEF